MTSKKDVNVIAVMNDDKVNIGSFPSFTIDVGDLSKFNSINDKNSTGSTREGLLAHEMVEQNELQNSDVKLADPIAKLNAFPAMHSDAINVENEVNGNIRLQSLEVSVGAPTYTKYFFEKHYFTVETVTNGTRDMKIDKRQIVSAIGLQ
jgi:hypothetical protein